MAGFYRSGYTTVEGEARVMASTQFEALDARRCFPCWDEPARKAVFQVLRGGWDEMGWDGMGPHGIHSSFSIGGADKGVRFVLVAAVQ